MPTTEVSLVEGTPSEHFELTDAQIRAISAVTYVQDSEEGTSRQRVIEVERNPTGAVVLRSGATVGRFKAGGMAVVIEPRCGYSTFEYMLWRGKTIAKSPEGYGGAQVDGSQLDVTQRFLGAVERLIRGGLAQGYRRVEEVGTRPRGRIDFAWSKGGLPFPTRYAYDRFGIDFPENQLLAAALDRLVETAGRNTEVGAKAARHREEFAVSPIAVAPRSIADASHIDRYSDAVWLAVVILEAAGVGMPDGRAPVSGVLYSMSRVFEDFVAEVTLNALPPAMRGEVQGRPTSRYLDVGRSLRLRPDIAIWGDVGCRLLVDAKYKVGADRATRADLYQMLAYSATHNACDALLIYAGAGRPLEFAFSTNAAGAVFSSFVDIERNAGPEIELSIADAVAAALARASIDAH